MRLLTCSRLRRISFVNTSAFHSGWIAPLALCAQQKLLRCLNVKRWRVGWWSRVSFVYSGLASTRRRQGIKNQTELEFRTCARPTATKPVADAKLLLLAAVKTEEPRRAGRVRLASRPRDEGSDRPAGPAPQVEEQRLLSSLPPFLKPDIFSPNKVLVC